MAKLYFLGGEDVVKRDSREINARAFADAGGVPNVLVLPWARASFDKAYERRMVLFEYFRALGASSVSFAEYSDPFEEIEEKVGHSDLIYLPGGLTSVLIERMRSKRVDNLLREFEKVIVGRSAGALALSNKCVLTKKKHKNATVTIPGIRLVDFDIKVHYNPSRDSQLKNLSQKEKIYAIPTGSALVCNDGALSFIGDVYLFFAGEKTLAN